MGIILQANPLSAVVYQKAYCYVALILKDMSPK